MVCTFRRLVHESLAGEGLRSIGRRGRAAPGSLVETFWANLRCCLLRELFLCNSCLPCGSSEGVGTATYLPRHVGGETSWTSFGTIHSRISHNSSWVSSHFIVVSDSNKWKRHWKTQRFTEP